MSRQLAAYAVTAIQNAERTMEELLAERKDSDRYQELQYRLADELADARCAFMDALGMERAP